MLFRSRRIENFPLPPGVLMANPHLVQPIQQPPNLVERNNIINLIHKVFGPLTPGVATPMYRKPYPEWIDRIELLRGLKFPTFSLFTVDGSQSIVVHIAKFTSQCAEV